MRVGCVLGIQGALWGGQEPLHAALRPHSTISRDAARLVDPCRGLCIGKPLCACKPSCEGSSAEPLESNSHRFALSPRLLTHAASAGWRVMCRKAEGRRTMAAKLTFETICTASRNTAAFAINRSRSLNYAGRLAQLCSSRRLTIPLLLTRFRIVPRQLACDSGRSAVAVTRSLRRTNSDARKSRRDRKTFLTRIEDKRQDFSTYGWTRPGADRGVACATRWIDARRTATAS